jgi:hypothetical protein
MDKSLRNLIDFYSNLFKLEAKYLIWGIMNLMMLIGIGRNF